MLNAKKLLEDGLLIISRDNYKAINPLKEHLDKYSKEEIYIRYGQLTSDNKICGIGRKISLSPKYYRSEIIDLIEDKTYIEEGQFKNDKLDGTFGRRIYIKGTTHFGWF